MLEDRTLLRRQIWTGSIDRTLSTMNRDLLHRQILTGLVDRILGSYDQNGAGCPEKMENRQILTDSVDRVLSTTLKGNVLALRVKALGQRELTWSLEEIIGFACGSVGNQDPNSTESRVPPRCWTDIYRLGGE
ncbi:hypothetical protein ACLOJK_041410, partial [Asimina triloba]